MYGMEIRRSRNSLGASVAGADLARMDNPAFNLIFRGVLEHRLLRIEGQSATAAQFRRFALRFGALLPPAAAEAPPHPLHPDIAVLRFPADRAADAAQAMLLYALEAAPGSPESDFSGLPGGPFPEAAYRHRWRAGDVLIWDSRCVTHRATGDTAAGTFYCAAIADRTVDRGAQARSGTEPG